VISKVVPLGRALTLAHHVAQRYQHAALHPVDVARNRAVLVLHRDEVLFQVFVVAVGKLVPHSHTRRAVPVSKGRTWGNFAVTTNTAGSSAELSESGRQLRPALPATLDGAAAANTSAKSAWRVRQRLLTLPLPATELFSAGLPV
jgi:hypothetical protein